MADWPCSTCTFINASVLTVCEMCGTPGAAVHAPPPRADASSAAPADDFVAAHAQMLEVKDYLASAARILYKVRACGVCVRAWAL